MFWIIRQYRTSWVLLLVPAIAALHVYLNEEEMFPDWFDSTVTTIVGVATGVLSFVLGLGLNTALNRNASGTALFNAYTGDLLALGMHTIALSTDAVKASPQVIQIKNNIRDLLLAGPGIMKWAFRGGVDPDLVQVKYINKNQSIKLYDRNQAMYCILKRYNSIGGVEALVLALGNQIHELIKSGAITEAAHVALLNKWEHIYGSYGNTGNLLGYQRPAIINWWEGVTLVIYLALMPYTLVSAGYHACYLSFIVAYFFLGMWVAAGRLADPYASGIADTGEFLTVSKAAVAAQQAIEELFAQETIGGPDNITCEPPSGAIQVSVSREEIEMREKNSLIGGSINY